MRLAARALGVVRTKKLTPAAPAKAAPPETSKEKVRPREARSVKKKPKAPEAPNRFEADTVIKSQYKLDGKQLEVDPD